MTIYVTADTPEQRDVLKLLETIIDGNHYSTHEDADIPLIVALAATQCLSHVWATHPTLEHLRPKSHGPLSARWKMTPQHLGPNVLAHIRIRENVALCAPPYQMEALAYFAREFCERALIVFGALRYEISTEISNGYSFDSFIEDLHVFDFMLHYCSTDVINCGFDKALDYMLQIEDTIKALRRMRFTQGLYDNYLKTANNILRLGAGLRFQYEPSPLPGFSLETTP